jgi:Ca2+/H+ antiporter
LDLGMSQAFVGFIVVALVGGAAEMASGRRSGRSGPQAGSVAALLVRWASWLFPTADLAVWREISTLATLGILCCVVLALVLRRGPITTRRLEGAIAVYLLLGFTWA